MTPWQEECVKTIQMMATGCLSGTIAYQDLFGESGYDCDAITRKRVGRGKRKMRSGMLCPKDRGGCGKPLAYDDGAFCQECMAKVIYRALMESRRPGKRLYSPAAAQSRQSRTPGQALRRPSGIGSPH